MTLPIGYIDNVFKKNQKAVVSTYVSIELPYKVGWVRGDDDHDVTLDIENGVTISVDDQCVLIV